MSAAITDRVEKRILARPEHPISRRDISSQALKVLYRLHRSGYVALLVGGSVRDLMLGRVPKDFDVATNARPGEIRRLFSNSRTIGRRFRLVHIFFKDEIVEVATFRASPEAPEGPDEWEEAAEDAAEDAAESIEVVPPAGPAEVVYGTPVEDANRRDFTINALFYDISDFSVIDYVGGIDDLEARRIRSIGDPPVRFREDPVRMMRALEYSVRLGFEIESGTAEAIGALAGIITEASRARLTYELLESLRSGCGEGICTAWRRAGIYERAFPNLPPPGRQVRRCLAALDRRIAAGERLPDPTVLGAIYLPAAVQLLQRFGGDGRRFNRPALLDALRELLAPGAEMHIPKGSLHLIHQGMFTLAKLQVPPERGRQVLKLSRQEYFSTAWALLSIAVETGLMPPEPHAAWSSALGRVQHGQTLEEGDGEKKKRRPRRRRRRRKRS